MFVDTTTIELQQLSLALQLICQFAQKITTTINIIFTMTLTIIITINITITTSITNDGLPFQHMSKDHQEQQQR